MNLPILRLGAVKEVARLQQHLQSLGLQIPCDSSGYDGPGFSAAATALARRNYARQQNRGTAHGRVGCHRRRQYQREHAAPLAPPGHQWRKINLGLRSCGGLACRPRQSRTS